MREHQGHVRPLRLQRRVEQVVHWLLFIIHRLAKMLLLSPLVTRRHVDCVRASRGDDPDAEDQRPRLGIPRYLALRRCDLSRVLSVRARATEHTAFSS